MAFYDLKLCINSPVSTADVCISVFQWTQQKLAIKTVTVFAISVTEWQSRLCIPMVTTSTVNGRTVAVSTATVFQIMLFKYRHIIEHLQHLMQ
jgi:hypothetical protein